MKEYICRIAQKGFFAGPVISVAPAPAAIVKTDADPKTEIAKFNSAAEKIKRSLENCRRCEKAAGIMDTVGMMLDDEPFLEEIRHHIAREKCCAEYAADTACRRYAERLQNAPSEYLRARAQDVSGFGAQLIRVMRGAEERTLSEVTALAAPDISPAQLTSFDPETVGGILTDKGSPNSHLSILAGNLGIPYLFGNAEAVAAAANSSFIILDGDRLITDPEEPLRKSAEARMAELRAEEKQAEELPDGTITGTKIYANISGPEDVPALLASGADGVGLFRSEFLFLGKDAAPSEEEQYRAYCTVLDAMKDKEVIIRTMDLGSDKRVSWLRLPEEENPALGLRGARVSLEYHDLFNVQLRALLRAGVHGNLKVMFPMIASDWELDEIRALTDAAAADLDTRGVPYQIPEFGIMIETPAAAMTADTLAKKAAFFSIGTNDLTQYSLAIDREAEGLDRYFNAHHEAVFRLIEKAVCDGHKNGVKVGVCGQLAADPEAIGRLISIGVDELSVPVSKVGKVRRCAAEAEAADAVPENVSSDSGPVFSPADGKLVPMEEIPDPAFSSGQLGKCIGILPDHGSVFSPCDGTLTAIAQTKHAVTVRSDSGEEYLIHVGIDTVKIGGEGFRVLIKEGERVYRAQKIMEADLGLIEKRGYSPMVILVKL